MKVKFLLISIITLIMATSYSNVTKSNNTPKTDITTATVSDSSGNENLNLAQSQTVQYFTDDDGLAIRGTDPVAYFTQGKPVPGVAAYEYVWNNATWRFVSAENRDKFMANPEKYAPQYGGFCAWAVSQGYTASIDPNAWRIVDGKLYLNYSQRIQKRWEKDISGNIAKADANWPQVLN